MSNLEPQSPLLGPLDWQRQVYFLSQHFHHNYLANSTQAGKYKRHGDFLKLLRRIEAYDMYVQQGDIVELDWQTTKDNAASVSNFNHLQRCFALTGYQPLTLLNSTAQVALSHHLDDELSRQMSVTANTTVARQMTKSHGQLLPEETAVRKLEAFLQLGRLLKTPEHIVQQEAAKQIEVTTGVNLRPLLLAAPAQNTIAPDEEMLEPTDLAKRFGLPHGAYVNQALEHVGWQIKAIGGGWTPTPAGAPYASRHAWTAKQGTKSGYNHKWNVTAVEQIFHAHGIMPQAQGS